MAKTKRTSTKKRTSKNTSGIRSFLSGRKAVVLLFAVIFAAIGIRTLFPTHAAPGDELQAKGNATWGVAIARRMVMAPDGSYGYSMDGYGGIHPFKTYGNMPAKPSKGPYFSGQDIARDIVITKWDPAAGPRGYVLDGFGAVHPFGGATEAKNTPYFKDAQGRPWDIARRLVIKGSGGYVLDGWGALHPFKIGDDGTTPPKANGPSFKGEDIARDVVLRSDGTVGLILTCNGGVTPVGFGSTPAPAYPNGFPYEKGRCDYQSFAYQEWSKPSGIVISGKGNFAGYGTWPINKPFTASGLGAVVDGQCLNNIGAPNVMRCWLMDNRGAIRAFGEPNVPLFTDQEQAFFAAIKRAQEEAAARAAEAARRASRNGGGTIPAGCSKPLNQIGPGDGVACIKALQAAVGARVDGIWGPETQSKRDAKFGGSNNGGTIGDDFMPGAGGGSGGTWWHSPASRSETVPLRNLSSYRGNYQFCGYLVGEAGAGANVSQWVNRRYQNGFGMNRTVTTNNNRYARAGQTVCQNYNWSGDGESYQLDYHIEVSGSSKVRIYNTYVIH